MKAKNVAQIFNLLYRQVALDRAAANSTRAGRATPCGLQVRDTAECNSALQTKRPISNVAQR
jgi:hypothetical protein